MIVNKADFFKLKPEFVTTFKNKVYNIRVKAHYSGDASVYAENVEKANELIEKFKNKDKDNKNDSWGYSFVDESSDFDDYYTDEESGIVRGIYYSG